LKENFAERTEKSEEPGRVNSKGVITNWGARSREEKVRGREGGSVRGDGEIRFAAIQTGIVAVAGTIEHLV